MEQEYKKISNIDLLRISTIFGSFVLAFDLLQYIISPSSLANYNGFWANIKFLIMAIGTFYVLKWFHIRSNNPKFIKYLTFISKVSLLVSLFDVFFYLLYFNVLNVNAKSILIDQLKQVYEQSFPTLPTDTAVQILSQNFSLYYSLGTMLNYFVSFLFYGFFYALFFKIFTKYKKQ